MATQIDVLNRSREIVVAGWAQGTFAANQDGLSVMVSSPNATCFCLSGAIDRAGADLAVNFQVINEADIAIACTIYDDCKLGIVSFNDTPGRTKDEILAVIDRTVERILKEG